LVVAQILFHSTKHKLPSEHIYCSRKSALQADFDASKKKMGQTRGLEPPHTGTTTRGLNHLATPATLTNIAFP
jgi:hypothetical protein